jgi:hypothetical protein
VFDPERDRDDGRRAFYQRLLAIAAISAAGCLALWPSVSGFAAGSDHQIGCLAVKDGWQADKAAPSPADRAAINAAFPPAPTLKEQLNPEALARWRVQWQAAQARPDVQRAFAYEDWIAGPGACVHESRHRLIRSGIGLVGLAGFVGGVTYFRRTRESLRRPPAELAGV